MGDESDALQAQHMIEQGAEHSDRYHWEHVGDARPRRSHIVSGRPVLTFDGIVAELHEAHVDPGLVQRIGNLLKELGERRHAAHAEKWGAK